MSKRVCYSYHPNTFVYQGLETAYECQIEKGKYILPDYSTFIAPPSENPTPNECYVWIGEKWVYQKRFEEEPFQDEKELHDIQEVTIKEKIDNLMNVKQELLRETQELVSKYKFFSQELDNLWFEYNNSQLKESDME
jgi:hypothetical protein